MQVVHLAVVVWSRQVVGAETAEEQSQEEVQQLETETQREEGLFDHLLHVQSAHYISQQDKTTEADGFVNNITDM